MRAAIYVRQSLDRTRQGAGVTRQREDCEKVAADRGWKVVEVLQDNDISASSGRRRPGYESLLSLVRAEEIDVVIAWASDRLHRRLADLVTFVDLVREHHVEVATVKSGDLDLSTPHGRMLAGILGSVAQAEVEQKGERQKRANRQRAETGSPRFSRRPYGYSEDGMRIVPSEAKQIREAAREILAGGSLRERVRWLNEANIPTSTGAAWTVTSLRRLLVNPRHAGLNAYRGDVIGRGSWKPVLDESTHHALVSLLNDPSRRLAPSNARKYLLSGLLVCGKCGGPMYACTSSPGARMIYRCRTQHLGRQLAMVDEAVTEAVLLRVAEPDAFELVAADSQADDLEAAHDETNSLRVRLDEAAGMYASGTITSGQLAKISTELRAKLLEVERRLADSARVPVLADLVGAADPDKVWKSMGLARKRTVIDLLMEVTILPCGRGVRADRSQVQIMWKA